MTSKLFSQSISSAGITLGVFAFFGVLLLASVQWVTKDSIAENIRLRHLHRLNAIIPTDSYNNDLLASAVEGKINLRGLANTLKTYKAKVDNKVVAEIFEVTSLEGYSGSISLLVGVTVPDQRLLGVRVTAHKETPGLGDKIETAKADWILRFEGKSLDDPSIDKWKVQKDGGVFDQFTGATITPRAVVNAVRETLKLSKGLSHE